MAQALENLRVNVAESPKPRIVQFQNRRFSVRLEPVYWQALEKMAEQQGMRLGRFIAQLSDRFTGGNFSSHLRVFCMIEAEKRLAQSYLGPSYGNLLDVVRAAPNPGIVLSRYRSIIAHNQAFAEWLGAPNQPIDGANLTSVLQVRTKQPLNDVWQSMSAAQLRQAEARVLYVAPGRVNAAQATFVALHSATGDEFYAVMWLYTSAARPAARLIVSAGEAAAGDAKLDTQANT